MRKYILSTGHATTYVTLHTDSWPNKLWRNHTFTRLPPVSRDDICCLSMRFLISSTRKYRQSPALFAFLALAVGVMGVARAQAPIECRAHPAASRAVERGLTAN